jgi:two-component system, sporulation sensor kinase E
MAVPIIIDDTLLGTLCASDPDPYSFTETELENMVLLATIYTYLVNQSGFAYSPEEDKLRMHAKSIISTLAADLADQVRNPMQTVKGFIQYLLEEPKFQQHKQVILDELATMEENIHSFLLTTKPAYPMMEKISLATSLVEATSSLKPEADKYNVSISLILETLPELKVDKSQIQRVFQNFIKNSIEATKNKNGTIQVRSFSESKQVVCIEISDNGQGIALNDLNKVGKPLYSSKDDGNGLGISVASDIINSHKGQLHIETTSAGTTVTIRLPISS